jgi:uncharacterized protein HemY
MDNMDNVVSRQIEAARKFLRTGKGRSAMVAINEGLEAYPENPLLLSYQGYLLCVVEKRHKEGIKMCKSAIGKLADSMPSAGEGLYPMLFLNLGRSILSSGDKAAAIKAFRNGMKAAPGNRDLIWEMKKLGTRKKPVVPFLNRNNLLNIYLGKLRGKIGR